jgi:hypothetical protein
VVVGLPEIVGGLFVIAAPPTVIPKAGREAVALPSFAEITMLE